MNPRQPASCARGPMKFGRPRTRRRTRFGAARERWSFPSARPQAARSRGPGLGPRFSPRTQPGRELANTPGVLSPRSAPLAASRAPRARYVGWPRASRPPPAARGRQDLHRSSRVRPRSSRCGTSGDLPLSAPKLRASAAPGRHLRSVATRDAGPDPFADTTCRRRRSRKAGRVLLRA